jgi:hypothetical protein
MNIIEFKKKEAEIKLLIGKLADEAADRYPIYDGINNIEEYVNSKYKILFVLKEPYDEKDGEGGGFSILNVIEKENYGRSFKTYYPLIYISYGILNDFTLYADMPDIQPNFKYMNSYLHKVAHINISKLPSLNRAKTIFSDIQEAYNKDLENDRIILKQIDAYNPDIIIGCGIGEILTEDLGLYYDATNACQSRKYPNILYVEAYHPAQFSITSEKYVDPIIQSVQSWFSNKKRP